MYTKDDVISLCVMSHNVYKRWCDMIMCHVSQRVQTLVVCSWREKRISKESTHYLRYARDKDTLLSLDYLWYARQECLNRRVFCLNRRVFCLNRRVFCLNCRAFCLNCRVFCLDMCVASVDIQREENINRVYTRMRRGDRLLSVDMCVASVDVLLSFDIDILFTYTAPLA